MNFLEALNYAMENPGKWIGPDVGEQKLQCLTFDAERLRFLRVPHRKGGDPFTGLNEWILYFNYNWMDFNPEIVDRYRK